MLTIADLVKGAIAEAEALDKTAPPQDAQAGNGGADVPIRVQLGRTAQANLTVTPCTCPGHLIALQTC